MKALVLAAGFGTRLRPLTNIYPKPLCPFFGIPFLDLSFYRIREQVRDIAVNTHYLSQKIEKFIDSHPLQDRISVFKEEKIRGTGGALFPIKDWLGDEDLLIYNADIISDIDINSLIKQHQRLNPVATMVMLPTHLEGKTPVYTKEDLILSFGDKPKEYTGKFTFSGIHVVSNRLVKAIPGDVPWSIIDTYRQFIKEKHPIHYMCHDGFWADLGTPKSLWESHIDIISAPQPKSLLESLGVTNIRKENHLPPITINQETLSAWSCPEEKGEEMYKSFVQTTQPIHQPIHSSIVIHHKEYNHKSSLNRCLSIDSIHIDLDD